MSRLTEDYSQKTDIRVKYDQLDRRRGARLQVTLAARQENHEKKVNGIRRAEQYIVLSPWSLAGALPHFNAKRDNEGQVALDSDLVGRFWGCIHGQPSEPQALSIYLRNVMRDAIRAPVKDP